MTSRDRADNRGGIPGRKPYRMVGTAIIVVAIGLAVLWMKVVWGGQDSVGGVETCAARRGPLTIRVLEAGALKAKDPAIVRSSMRRRATILSIVPEGVRVQKGDLLVELDVSELVDHCVDHRIMVKNAEAAWINARESLIITKSLAQSSVEQAQLAYDFAKLDLEKYEGAGGQFETDLAKAEGNIALSQQEVEKNSDYFDWSQRLADEKYLSETQLKADELTLRKSELNLKVAQNNLELLEKYTYQRQLTQLKSDVNQAEAALERAKAKARANVAQAEARLAAREQEYQHQQEMLAMHEEEIRQSKLYAPADGMVIYATSGQGRGHRDDRQPLMDGVEVWNRQELIYLQRSAKTIAEVDLHEANLEKVCVGLPAVVTVDALPGRKFMGTVSHITPLPDPRNMWMNPDLKLYTTEIALEANEPELRSGMNCKAEIIVEQHKDTIYVPIETVVRVDGQPTVYVLDGAGQTEERQVEIGLDDNTMIRIVSGLSEGERVLLAPPVEAGTAAFGMRLAGIRGADANDLRQEIRERLKAANGPAPAVGRPKSGGPGQERTQ